MSTSKGKGELDDRMDASLSRSAPSRTENDPRPKAPRVKPVRITVDLPSDLHKRLKVWCAENDASLADVQRGLSRKLLEDPELAAWLTRHLDSGG